MKTLNHFVNYNAKVDTFVFDFNKDGRKDDIIKIQESVYEIIDDDLVDVYHFAYIPEYAWFKRINKL